MLGQCRKGKAQQTWGKAGSGLNWRRLSLNFRENRPLRAPGRMGKGWKGGVGSSGAGRSTHHWDAVAHDVSPGAANCSSGCCEGWRSSATRARRRAPCALARWRTLSSGCCARVPARSCSPGSTGMKDCGAKIRAASDNCSLPTLAGEARVNVQDARGEGNRRPPLPVKPVSCQREQFLEQETIISWQNDSSSLRNFVYRCPGRADAPVAGWKTPTPGSPAPCWGAGWAGCRGCQILRGTWGHPVAPGAATRPCAGFWWH